MNYINTFLLKGLESYPQPILRLETENTFNFFLTRNTAAPLKNKEKAAIKVILAEKLTPKLFKENTASDKKTIENAIILTHRSKTSIDLE